MKIKNLLSSSLILISMLTGCGEIYVDEADLPLSSQYIYNTLSDTEKKEYKKFDTAISDYKSSAKVSHMNEDEFNDFYLKFYCSRVDLFFLNSTVHYTVNFDGTVSECMFDYDNYSGSTETMNNRINDAADSVIAEIPESYDTAHKLKYIHNYLVDNTVYDAESDDCDNIFGALIRHRTHCQGYSKTMSLFCDKLSVPSLIITGETNGGGHMWNMVNLDGNWYHIDVTWDDPDCGNRSSSNYFLVSDSKIKETHTFDTYLDYPAADSDYDI